MCWVKLNYYSDYPRNYQTTYIESFYFFNLNDNKYAMAKEWMETIQSWLLYTLKKRQKYR